MGARCDACHGTRLLRAAAGYRCAIRPALWPIAARYGLTAGRYLLWYRRAVRTSLYHSKYAPGFALINRRIPA